MSLKGKKVVFTGKMSKTRKEMKAEAKAAGIDVDSAVTSNTDLLVCGIGVIAKASNGKFKDALKHGTEYVEEDEYRNRLQGQKSTSKGSPKDTSASTNQNLIAVLNTLTVRALKKLASTLEIDISSSARKASIVSTVSSEDIHNIVSSLHNSMIYKIMDTLGLTDTGNRITQEQEILKYCGIEVKVDSGSVLNEDLIRSFFTNVLNIPFNAPTQVALGRLYSYFESLSHPADFFHSKHSLILGKIFVESFLQLFGETVRKAESYGSLFEDGSRVVSFCIDMNYQYDDGYCILSNPVVMLMSDSNQYQSSDWFDVSHAGADLLQGIEVSSIMYNLAGEDSYYEGDYHRLVAGTRQGNSECPVRVCTWEDIINRNPEPFNTWIVDYFSLSKAAGKALQQLLDAPKNANTWAARFIPRYPELVEVLFPIQGEYRSLREILKTVTFPDYFDQYVVANIPSNQKEYLNQWTFNVNGIASEIADLVLRRADAIILANNTFWNTTKIQTWIEEDAITDPQERDDFREAYLEGLSLQDGVTVSSAQKIWYTKEVANLSTFLKRVPQAEQLDFTSEISALGTTGSAKIKKIGLHSNYQYKAWDSLEDLAQFLSTCPNLKSIYGDWPVAYKPALMGKEIQAEIKLLHDLHHFLQSTQYTKLKDLLNGDTESIAQGLELWLSVRPHGETELRRLSSINGDSTLELNWSTQKALEERVKKTDVENTHFSLYDYDDCESLVDLRSQKTVTNITISAQPRLNILNVTGLTNLTELSIYGANYLQEIKGLETCTSLKSITLTDSTGVMEYQNELYCVYSNQSLDFQFTQFQWSQFADQLSKLSALEKLILKSDVADLTKCVLPNNLKELHCWYTGTLNAIFPDSLEVFFHTHTHSSEVERVLSLPNIKVCRASTGTLVLPSEQSSLELLDLSVSEVSNLEVLSNYSRLKELYIEAPHKDTLSKIQTISGCHLKSVGIIPSDREAIDARIAFGSDIKSLV